MSVALPLDDQWVQFGQNVYGRKQPGLALL